MGFLCLRIKIVIGLSRRYDGVVFVLSAIFYRFSRKILFCGNCACFFVVLFGNREYLSKKQVVKSVYEMSESTLEFR